VSATLKPNAIEEPTSIMRSQNVGHRGIGNRRP
jgi:hypothetical protein